MKKKNVQRTSRRSRGKEIAQTPATKPYAIDWMLPQTCFDCFVCRFFVALAKFQAIRFFSIQFCFFCVYFFLYVVIARHFRRKTQQKIKHEKNKNGESMANLDKSMSTKKKTQRKTNWFGNSFVADFRSSFIRRSFSFWITAKMPTATFCSHSYFRLFHSFCLHLIYFVDCRTSDLTENSFVCFEHCSN